MGWVWLLCQLATCITDTTYALAYQPATLSSFNMKHTYLCVCVSRRTESGLSVDSLPSHLLAAESLNYESSDTDYEKTAAADDCHNAVARKVSNPFTCWTDQLLSFSAWHCWLGHLTRKIVSDMTYNVFRGTLNPAQSINLSLTPDTGIQDIQDQDEWLITHKWAWQGSCELIFKFWDSLP